MRRPQGGAGVRPLLNNTYNQGWKKREEIPAEEGNSMRHQSTNTDLLIGTDDCGNCSSLERNCLHAFLPSASFTTTHHRTHDDDGVYYHSNAIHSNARAVRFLGNKCNASLQSSYPRRSEPKDDGGGGQRASRRTRTTTEGVTKHPPQDSGQRLLALRQCSSSSSSGFTYGLVTKSGARMWSIRSEN